MTDETPREEDGKDAAPGEETPDAGTPHAAPPVVDGEAALPDDVIEARPAEPEAGFGTSGATAPEDAAPEPVEAEVAEPEPPPALTPPVPPPPPRPPKEPKEPPAARRPGGIGRLLRRLVMIGLIVGIALPVGVTLVYRFVGPPITILMVQRLFEGRGLDRRWVSIDRMAPSLPLAVIAAEDARYCSHHGFDFEAMEKALKNNKRRPTRIRGGSTVSQQTAKNVFLWPQRSYVRKGLEAYFTVLIETLWGKKRIMEVYLNTAEWGPGIYGAEAAARRYFGVGADQLSAAQSARLAAILPSPLKWRAARPGPYVKKRSRRIGAASGTVRREGLAACLD